MRPVAAHTGVALIACLVACYRPTQRDCVVGCGAGGMCPDGMECGPAGLCVQQGAPPDRCSVAMDGDASPGDDAGEDAALLRILVTGRGRVEIAGTAQMCAPGPACEYPDFTLGTAITLVAIPETPAFELSAWGGACSGNEPDCALTLTVPTTDVTATFVQKNEDG
jgi:hypothetical protein